MTTPLEHAVQIFEDALLQGRELRIKMYFQWNGNDPVCNVQIQEVVRGAPDKEVSRGLDYHSFEEALFISAADIVKDKHASA